MMKSRRYTLALGRTLVALFAATACSSPVEPPCTAEDLQECWQFLGLEDEVTALANTEWGLLAGTLDTGVLRHVGATASWDPIGLTQAQVRAIAAVPRSEHGEARLLAGVSPRGMEKITSAIHRSTDGGLTWTASDMGWADSAGGFLGVSALAVDSSELGRVFWAAGGNVLRSDDAGISWQFIVGDLDTMAGNTYALTFGPDGSLWVCGQGVFFGAFVWRTVDAGSTWESMNPTPNMDNVCTALFVDRRDPRRIWIGVAGEVLTTADGGETWTSTLSLQRSGIHDAYISEFVLHDGWLYAIGFERQEMSVLSNLLVYARPVSGGSWVRVPIPVTATGGWSAVVGPHEGLLIGTETGVWRFAPVS
jgi:hypothetical protein